MDGAFIRYREGEDGAAADAVRAYGPVGWSAAFGILRDAAASEAIAAQVIGQGLAGEVALTGEETAERAWVAAEARRQALWAVLSRRRRGRFGRKADAEPTIPAAHTMLDLIDPAEALQAFERLPFEEREALSLAAGSGLDAEAIGVRLSMTSEETLDLVRDALLHLEDALLGTEPAR